LTTLAGTHGFRLLLTDFLLCGEASGWAQQD
jgi:hypothetical protein